MTLSRNGKHRLSGSNSVSIAANTAGLESYLEQLGDAVEESVRPVAQAGAQVMYDKVKANVASLGRVTGNLDKSIYQVFSETQSSDGKATYHISWNHTTAPHAHLVEYGYIQRYVVVNTSKGPRTAIRPEAQGKPKPRGDASQAEKDAYYVPRPGGPVQIAGKAFVRGAQSELPKALDAMEAEVLKRIGEIK